MTRLWWLLLISSVVAEAQILDDPTRPATQSPSSAVGGQAMQDATSGIPVVTAIFIGPQQRHAIVEGKMLAQGQQYQGMELKEIRTGSVIFRHNDNDIEVTLRQGKTLKKGKANGF